MKALEASGIDYEILVVDDSSTDRTRAVVSTSARRTLASATYASTTRAASASPSAPGSTNSRATPSRSSWPTPRTTRADLVRYHRAARGGLRLRLRVPLHARRRRHDYPTLKLVINRLANSFIRLLFRHGYNDTTNAFKAYRREVIDTVQPLLSNHFNLTVELPLKAVVRGHSYGIVPITWRNRKAGTSKLRCRRWAAATSSSSSTRSSSGISAAATTCGPAPPRSRRARRRLEGSRQARRVVGANDRHSGESRLAGPARRSAAWQPASALVLAVFAFLVVVAFVLLYRKGLGTTFYYDEWNFVMNRREWDVETFLRAHNEHLSLLPVLIFKLLFVTVGLDSYGVYRVAAPSAPRRLRRARLLLGARARRTAVGARCRRR